MLVPVSHFFLSINKSRVFVNGAELAKRSQRRRTNGAEPPVSSSVDYCWNKWALRWRLKEHRVVSGVLRAAGRLFHVRGPLTAKGVISGGNISGGSVFFMDSLSQGLYNVLWLLLHVHCCAFILFYVYNCRDLPLSDCESSMYRVGDGSNGLVSQTVGPSWGLPVHWKRWRCDSGIYPSIHVYLHKTVYTCMLIKTWGKSWTERLMYGTYNCPKIQELISRLDSRTFRSILCWTNYNCAPY